MIKNDNLKVAKVVNNFYCNSCNYNCVRKYNFDKHLMTQKHKMITNGNAAGAKVATPTQSINKCNCGKVYKYSSGLSRHKHSCKFISQNTEETSNKQILELLVKQNKQILALTENSGIQNIQNFQQNIQQNIQNNMTFNLNYFLNEKCKNAINMSEFIESSEANFNDLENTGKNGLVKSLTQFIIKELSKLDVFERPIHCSDTRRKILHIKDKNQWQKDTEGQKNAKITLRKINHKVNILQIPHWLKTYPNSNMADNSLNELYLKIVSNSMDGTDETYDKIISNVSEKITINKKNPQNMLK